jgi:hypothetical protein
MSRSGVRNAAGPRNSNSVAAAAAMAVAAADAEAGKRAEKKGRKALFSFSEQAGHDQLM